MTLSSHTLEGYPGRCRVCGYVVRIEPSTLPGDAACPACGTLLWFNRKLLPPCFSPEEPILDIQATEKREVIEEMVGALVASGRLPAEQQESVMAAILDREELGPTGIGRGVAIPHARHAAVVECTGLVGRSKSGVDFDSLDGEPANLFFLLISPLNQPDAHCRMLEAVGRMLRDRSSWTC